MAPPTIGQNLVSRMTVRIILANWSLCLPYLWVVIKNSLMKHLLAVLLLIFVCSPGAQAQHASLVKPTTSKKFEKFDSLNLRPKQERKLMELHKRVQVKMTELKEAGQLYAESPELAALRENEIRSIEAILNEEQVAIFRAEIATEGAGKKPRKTREGPRE